MAELCCRKCISSNRLRFAIGVDLVARTFRSLSQSIVVLEPCTLDTMINVCTSTNTQRFTRLLDSADEHRPVLAYWCSLCILQMVHAGDLRLAFSDGRGTIYFRKHKFYTGNSEPRIVIAISLIFSDCASEKISASNIAQLTCDLRSDSLNFTMCKVPRPSKKASR